MFNLPNIITLINLVCGILSIIWIIEGNVSYVWIPFVGCLLADFLDGFVARLLNQQSEMGKELDSLCDIVSFGVLPGIMMYSLLRYIDPVGYLPYISILIPAFAALRLAKFNISIEQSTYFIGVPSPGSALFISGVFFALINGQFGEIHNTPTLVAITLIGAIMMVIPYKMFSLKMKGFALKEQFPLLIIGAIGIATGVLFGALGISITIFCYIIISFIFSKKIV